jgi:hypothetical protein
MDYRGIVELTTTNEKSELIRLVRKTMGEQHPTGERIVGYIKGGHTNLAVRALEESIEGLRALIGMDEEDADEMAIDAPEETKDEDRQDLDKYQMLLDAIKES